MTWTLPKIATAFWLLALLFSFSWLSDFEIEFVIAALSSLVIALALNDGAGIKSRQWPFPPLSPVLIAGGLFWLCALVSVATSKILFVSWIYFFFFSALPLTIVFFLVGHHAQSRLHLAEQGVKLILTGLAVFALVQFSFFPKMLTAHGRVFEPFADPNSLASILSIGIFLAAGDLLQKKSPSWLSGVILLLCSGALFATGSRGALLSLLVMAGVLVALIGMRHIERRHWLIGAGVTVATLAIIGMISADYSSGLIRLLINPAAVVPAWDGAYGDRMPIWTSTVQIIKDHLWTGTGIGTFQYYYPEVRAASDMTYGYMAHNDPLQFASEMGIFAPVLFYLTLMFAVWRTCSTLRLLPRGDVRRVSILIPFCALGAFVMHAHFTYNFHTLPGLMLAGFMFALWYQATATVRHEVPHIFSAPSWLNNSTLEAMFLIVAFAAITVIAGPYSSQRLVILAEKDLQEIRLAEFAQKINLADTLSLGTNAQAYSQAARVPLGILEQTQKPLSAQERAQFKQDAARLLDQAVRANPRDPEIIIQQGQLTLLEERADDAEIYFRTALKTDPYSLPARMALGAYLDSHGKGDEAVSIMNEGLDLKYGPARAGMYMEYFIQTMSMQEAQAQRKKLSPKKVP